MYNRLKFSLKIQFFCFTILNQFNQLDTIPNINGVVFWDNTESCKIIINNIEFDLFRGFLSSIFSNAFVRLTATLYGQAVGDAVPRLAGTIIIQ